MALTFGAMIGCWVALTGNWIDRAGSLGAILAFVIEGTAAVLVGLTYAELASAMPQAGGEHVYSRRAQGATACFICTWAILLGYVSVVAFEAVALPAVVDYLVSGFSRGYLWTVAGWDAVFGSPWAGRLLVLAGIGGILTSWNAFLIGGSRALYALARAGQLPQSLGVLHPRYNTPHNAVLLIGALSVIAPLFGRPAMVWLVDAGGLGIITAYVFVTWSFLRLKAREPAMQRPYAVRHGRVIGTAALVPSLGLAAISAESQHRGAEQHPGDDDHPFIGPHERRRTAGKAKRLMRWSEMKTKLGTDPA